jgi:pimeloyl-ACP methyl ester carboxylesterase
VEAGFHETPDGEVTLACTPEWEAFTFSYYNIDPPAAIAALRAPAIVLFGDTDASGQLAPPELAAHPGVRVETLAGATHFLPMERPQAVRDALREAAGARGPAFRA